MSKKNTFRNTIYNLLVGIIIFLVPTNFFLKFFETSAYVNGLLVDYLIPKLYLSDIFILSLLAFWFINWLAKNATKKKSWGKKLKALLKKSWTKTIVILFVYTLGGTIFIIRQFWTSHPISSITYLLKIIELGLFATFLIKNKKIIDKIIVEKAILATLFFQSSIAIYQYINQKSLYGYLLLGEPNLSNYIGITKSSLFGVEKILPYGTTTHPNVLGGFLALYLLYIFNKTKLEISTKAVIKNVIIAMAIFALFLTQSISAVITLILGLTLTLFQNHWKEKYPKKISKYFRQKLTFKNTIFIVTATLLISIFSLNLLANKYPENQSIVRRNYLNTATLNMAKSNFLVGVGLNNFTARVEDFSSNREIVRFVQPVHNIFLLFFAETGALGVVILGIIILKSPSYKDWSWILVLLPIALLDHYLLTLNTGMLMIVFMAHKLLKSD